MADHKAIQNLIADYGWANDTKDVELLGRLFTEDAVYTIQIAGMDEPIGPLNGRAEIVEFVGGTITAQTDQRRHVLVNPRFFDEKDDQVLVRVYLSLHVADKGVVEVKTSGVYEFSCVRTAEAWKIQKLNLDLDAGF